MLYGLNESEDAWNRKLKAAIIKVLKMIQMTGDQAMYIHEKWNLMVQLSATAS